MLPWTLKQNVDRLMAVKLNRDWNMFRKLQVVQLDCMCVLSLVSWRRI